MSLLFLLLLGCIIEGRGSSNPRSCSKFEFSTLWTSSLRNSPLMVTPLLIDVDGDSLRDIIAPSYSGEVYAIHGENGHIVDNWPFYLEDRAFYASPLAYDVDNNGALDIVLTTTDAEIIFLKTDNTLFHGETVKIPPIRVRKEWYELDKEYVQNLAAEMVKLIGNRFVPDQTNQKRETVEERFDDTENAFSDIENRMGKEADPLYSRHQPNVRLSGLDPTDSNFVFIDPHVLATPTISDLNGDGIKAELIVPVSYYFDNYQYGIPSHLAKTHLTAEELAFYAAEGIVVVDLRTRQILKQKVLSLTKINANQPAYLLNSPTVVKLGQFTPMSVIVGSATGKLHVLEGLDLVENSGFPIIMDSISAQVAVEDLTGDGVLEMVVGDGSGNVVCVDHSGKRLWEHEAKVAIESSVRFANLYNDKSMEVVFVTKYGDLWVLNGTTGVPLSGFPMSLNTLVHSSVYLMHLSPKSASPGYHLSAIVPAVSGMYVVDLYGGCVDLITTKEDIVPHTLQSDHIDPFNPGLEVLATSLSGELICFSTSTVQPSDFEISIETWPADTLNGNGFTHKGSSFALVCGRGLSPRDASGTSFKFRFEVHDNRTSKDRPHHYNMSLSIGNLFVLVEKTFVVTQPLEEMVLHVATPPIPTRATMNLELCNIHHQCDSASFTVRFNQSFQDTFGWCLALPFFALVASYLWLLRNESTVSLPTVIKPQKWS